MINLNTWIKLTTLVVLSLIILILSSKIKIYFNFSFLKRNKKINNTEINNLTLEKIIIIFFQILILVLNYTTILISKITCTLILLFHFIICLSFFIKKNKKIKIWNNFLTIKLIVLITIICCQFLFLSWQIHNIMNLKYNNFLWIIIFYIIFLSMTYTIFNQSWLISKYLIFNTIKVLTAKKVENFYFNQKKIISFYSKVKYIINLWNFENLKKSKEMNIINIKEKSKKIIKTNWIIFIISYNNLLYKNIIKTQKNIINGWKNSLIE